MHPTSVFVRHLCGERGSAGEGTLPWPCPPNDEFAFLFLAVFVALAGLRFYWHYNTLKMIENGRWAAHAQKIDTELGAMLSALDEARAARRDYLATRDARRAAEFEDARRRTTEAAARLQDEAENRPP